MKRILFAAVSSLMLLVACKPQPEKITVSPDNIQLFDKTATAQLTAQAVDKTGAAVEGVTLTWSSSDPAVVTVEADGKVTPVGSGNATVSAKTDKISADIPVTVSLASKLSVDKTQLTLTPEMVSDAVVGAIQDEKGGNWTGQPTITWTSADPKVATVDETGKVTGVGPGTTTISAAFKELKADVTVTSTVPAAAPVDPAAAAAAPTDPAAAPATGAAAPAAAAPAAAPAAPAK